MYVPQTHKWHNVSMSTVHHYDYFIRNLGQNKRKMETRKFKAKAIRKWLAVVQFVKGRFPFFIRSR